MKQALAFLKRIVRRIPGFRQVSSSSMVIAATWYGVALLTMAKYWHWGLAMLALPFFVFYLIDGNVMKNKRLCRIVAIAAGCLVLLGAAGGLTAGTGATLKAAVTAQVFMPTASAEPSASEGITAAETAPASAAPTETASAHALETTGSPSGLLVVQTQMPAGLKAGQFAFVASKTGEVFHRPGCGSAKRIKPANLIGFATREEAIAAGLRPCKQCKP